MKIRTAALAGASLLYFATPAFAGDGWYLGLGAGWSDASRVTTDVTTCCGHINFGNAFRGDITAGFKTPDGWRVELEAAAARYPVTGATNPGGIAIPKADGWVAAGTFMA